MKKKIDHNKSGLAGECAVLSRLYQKGFDASLTFGNTKSFDIFGADSKTNEKFKIEVKTVSSRNKLTGGKWGKHLYWQLNKSILERNYKDISFAFVWLPEDDTDTEKPD